MRRPWLTILTLLAACAKPTGPAAAPSLEHGVPAIGGAGPTTEPSCRGVRVPSEHRATSIDCPTQRPAASLPAGFAGCGQGSQCLKDADCTAGNNGRCLRTDGSPACATICSYDECVRDADCPGGAACDCRIATNPTVSNLAADPPNVCRPAGECRVDADCGACGFCSASDTAGSVCGRGGKAYHCHTPADACTDDADCAGEPGSPPCSFQVATRRWACGYVCGGPPP